MASAADALVMAQLEAVLTWIDHCKIVLANEEDRS
jgi:hypothetical protein